MLTVVELAAYLGVTPNAIHQAIRRHGIRPWGKRGKANLYNAREVLRHTGRHDRLAPRTEAVSK